MGAHPDIAGLPTSDKENKGRSLTGDYIYYMGEFINKAGYNFMFFNGAICGIYCGRGPVGDARPSETKGRWEETRRYGYEVARMTLGMTMTLSEIEQDPLLYNEEEITADREYTESREGTYTLWCENWEPVSQVQVEPFFNIMLREVELEITNPLMSIAGKLNLANYNVYKTAEGAYKIRTEVGYMEFGNQLKVAMAPGEFCSDLVAGGTSLTAKGSTSGKDFESKPLTEIFGEGITVFGLANDAIGYIVPDNDYSLAIAFDHYQELISLGKGTASAVMEGFAAIAESI